MDVRQIERIKRLAVIAMFSDDELLDILVLKGGSAIDLLHPASGRASRDLDFSIDGDFNDDIDSLRNRFDQLLRDAFAPAGFVVFDVRFKEQPQISTPDLPFWGGYALEFKLAEPEIFEKYKARLQKLRSRHSLDVGPRQLKTFSIHFSKHEYCSGKQEHELDGYIIYAYPPQMIACEKVRAICQQAPEYRKMLKSRPGTPRARDFFDIQYLSEQYDLPWTGHKTAELLRAMFEAKKVPLSLLGRISEFRDFHRQGFPAVVATVRPGHKLRDFDFYFDYVLERVSQLEPFGDK